MNRAARLLGLALSSALLVPVAPVSRGVQPVNAAQSLEDLQIPGFFGAGDTLPPTATQEPRDRDPLNGERQGVEPLALVEMPQVLAQVDSHQSEADRLFQQGIEQFNRSQFREALASWQQALELYRALGNRQRQGAVLENLGTAYANLGDYRRAIEFFEQALAIRREQLGDNHPDVAQSLNSLAELYQAMGRYGEAEALFQQALAIRREQLGDGHPDVAQSLNSLAALYQAQDRYGEAELLYQQALAILRQGLGPAHSSHAISLNNLALLYQAQRRYEDAEPLYQEALAIARAVGDLDSEAGILSSLGVNFFQLREYSEAIRFYEQELAIQREIGNRAGEGNTLLSLGWSYAFQAQYELALNYFNDSLNISKEIGDDDRTANISYALGWTYHSLGDFNSPLELYQSALSIFEKNNNSNGLLNILSGLGWIYIDLDQIDLSIDFFRRQLDTSRLLSSRRQEANALNGLGSAYTKLNEYQSAINYSKQALEIHREINDVREEAYALGDIGNAYAALGDYQAALDYLTECLLIQRGLNNRWGEGKTLSSIAQVFKDQQQPELAITFLKASVAVRESIREDIRNLDVDLRQSFTNTIADDYRLLADLLLSQGRIPEAQQVLDLLKLEELREFTDTRSVWTGTALAYTEIEQPVIAAHGDLIAFSQRYAECQRSRCAEFATLSQQLTALNAQYQARVATFQDQVRQQRRDDEVFQDPNRLGSDARALLAANPNSVLIYPFVTEEKLWLLWATPGAMGSVEVAVSQAELSRAVQQLGERLTQGGDLSELQAASQQLYDWLVRPLEAPLEANGIEKLIFVNDRVTRYIPMAVLFDGERYLLERYTLSTVLSPAVTNTTNRLGAVEDAPVLGLGLTQAFPGFNPLPAVREELAAIVRAFASPGQGIFPGLAFLDGDFTLANLEQNLLGHRVLHIATHAAFVPGLPGDSYILLGDGSRLTVADIEAREHLLADLHLVVLSACQTALGGPAGDGAEITGISSYFLAPGRAETVIASLWSVNDTSTSVLMQRFYGLLATGQFTKAEALRQAQLSLLRGEDGAALGDRLALSRGSIELVFTQGQRGTVPAGYGHPYHWAPFILIGNGL
ncbi:CHAT domain-containing protein [Leptolyngbya sp. PCC 6406]|uniref:CHAT domain-containing protein n=1 Tax=Leptolyngbya sp. PCC 6406 TaxID=1173264 RepID=UPI0002AC7861|nr:tetratricopeptide repeat protein [Leptolyngbya sp. PCC 6406]